jgi:alpha-tubulin suppressor-like RCC1 family protein
VEDLLDLPTGKIRKISSGGYVTAAITVGNDLYVWGGRPGQPKLLEQMEGYPTPVDLEGLDILDVAVGDGHILALSTDNRLFIVGDGGNGQLGLGSNIKELADWKEVSLPLKEGQKMVRVHAGYKNSFVVVE